MSQQTNRIGIASVSLGLLESWLHLPIGTHVRDVRSKAAGAGGYFEILLEGDAVPETPLLSPTPYVDVMVVSRDPEITITLRDPRAAACDCQHPEVTADGFAAVSVDCPIHGDRK